MFRVLVDPCVGGRTRRWRTHAGKRVLYRLHTGDRAGTGETGSTGPQITAEAQPAGRNPHWDVVARDMRPPEDTGRTCGVSEGASGLTSGMIDGYGSKNWEGVDHG